MSALTVDHEPHQGWDDLVRIWEDTDAPEGCKVEIIEGIVTVSPTPSWDHNFTAGRVQRRLYAVLPEEWEIVQTMEAAVPSRKGLYIPDLMVVAENDKPAPGELFSAPRQLTNRPASSPGSSRMSSKTTVPGPLSRCASVRPPA